MAGLREMQNRFTEYWVAQITQVAYYRYDIYARPIAIHIYGSQDCNLYSSCGVTTTMVSTQHLSATFYLHLPVAKVLCRSTKCPWVGNWEGGGRGREREKEGRRGLGAG